MLVNKPNFRHCKDTYNRLLLVKEYIVTSFKVSETVIFTCKIIIVVGESNFKIYSTVLLGTEKKYRQSLSKTICIRQSLKG